MADKNRKRDKIFMDLKQLQYFVVCAQTGSFSDAAKNLYSTQPSVSKVIKGLEDTLGMQLFEPVCAHTTKYCNCFKSIKILSLFLFLLSEIQPARFSIFNKNSQLRP